MQGVYSHESQMCDCEMTFGVFLPEIASHVNVPVLWYLSGLTCTHENAMIKSGGQQWAEEKGIALVFPDTSPRGQSVCDDQSFDLGQGASFYIDSELEPWKKNFQMESYIRDELSGLIINNFPIDKNKQGITGHSMGGLGALNLAFKNPEIFMSVSAFSPISNPSKSEWGKKQFRAYLGDDQSKWEKYDPSVLLGHFGFHTEILIDQGTNDEFIDLLKPSVLEGIIKNKPDLGTFRYQKGYDHSYYFVTTFMKDHIDHHSKILKG
jgi:S-formylglutathione hydrolase